MHKFDNFDEMTLIIWYYEKINKKTFLTFVLENNLCYILSNQQ